jgi:hypothetical protein
MENIDFEDIASKYGMNSESAKSSYDDWVEYENDNGYGDSSTDAEDRFDSYLSTNFGSGPSSPRVNSSFAGSSFAPSSTVRTPVEFVPSDSIKTRDTPAFEPEEATFGLDDNVLYDTQPAESEFLPSHYAEDDEFETADSIFQASDSVYASGSSFEDALADPRTTVESSDPELLVNATFPSDSTEGFGSKKEDPLDSWDDMFEAIDSADVGSEAPDTSFDDVFEPDTSHVQSEADQHTLQRFLIHEANNISSNLTSAAFVFAVVPNTNMASSTLLRIRGSKKEKELFVLSHLLAQSGSQSAKQTFDRPYSSLDGTEYNLPSTGSKRFIRRGNTFRFGKVDDAVTNKFGKKIKAVYLTEDCDKVLG